MKRAKKTRPVFWRPRLDVVMSKKLLDYLTERSKNGGILVEWRRPQL